MSITLEEAKKELEKSREAYDQARKGQRYSWGDRSLSMPDLETLRDDVAYWERRVSELEAQKRGTTNKYSVARFV